MVTLLRTARTLTTPTCRRTTSLMWSRQRSASARATCKFILYVRSISRIDLFPHFIDLLVILPLIHHPSFCLLCCPYICICKISHLSLYGKLYYIPSYWKCNLPMNLMCHVRVLVGRLVGLSSVIISYIIGTIVIFLFP